MMQSIFDSIYFQYWFICKHPKGYYTIHHVEMCDIVSGLYCISLSKGIIIGNNWNPYDIDQNNSRITYRFESSKGYTVDSNLY
jgi:hypothetical protein